MIVTVTLNPSLDRTVEVDALLRGQVLRAHPSHLHPGGKGVNVTRALTGNGYSSRAIVAVGGAEGDELVRLLGSERVDAVFVPIKGRTRSNITIVEPDGTVTKVNEPGAPLMADELEFILARALAEAHPDGWVVLCGSLPPGVMEDQYASMARRIIESGMRVAVDAGGPTLAKAAAAGPELIKPNVEELATAVGRPIRTRADLIRAASQLHSLGAAHVLVTLGPTGAVMIDEHGVTVGEPATIEPRSTVGAGDAFLAGFLAAATDRPSGAAELSAATGSARVGLTQALAWGTAAVQLPGSEMPRPQDIDPSTVRLLKPHHLDRWLADERIEAERSASS